MEIFEETSDGSNVHNDGHSSPTGSNVPTRHRLFRVKYAPEAVVNWYMIALDKNTTLKKSAVKEDALGHLLSMGWKIYYIQKKTKQELRYKCPNGRVYISLRTACKTCIDQGGAALALPTAVTVSEHSPHPSVGEGKETAPFLKKPNDDSEDSECVKSPAPPLRNWGNIKTPPSPPEAAAGGTSQRHPRIALSNLIDQSVVSPGDRAYYKISSKNDPLMAWGSITNEGLIKCDCCSEVFSISNFEAHTGSTKRRPAANIFLEDGRSLLDCQMQIDQNQNQNQNETKGNDQKVNKTPTTLCMDKNDSICSICHFGGELILCVLCPAAFHGGCLGFKGIPLGDWACPSCCCKICGQVPYNFDGVVSDHQPDASLVKCVQCEQNVHIGCVRSVQFLEDGNPNQAMDRENWFCTKRCEDIHMGLQKLLWKRNPVGVEQGNLTWTLMKHTDTMSEHQRKRLNTALGVMRGGFRPSKDPNTNHELMEDVVFSRRSNSKRLNFEGFYTVILERKNAVTTVATVRVYGEEVAEVPFVVTRLRHRRHGMCRTLMNELERQLMKLGVKTVTLPAVGEALNIWIDRFGFSKMTCCERLELAKYTLLGFQHTVRCQKDLEKRISNDAEWCPMKWPTPSVEEHDISVEERDISVEEHDILDHMSFDDWSSISDAFD
ncbi:increased DNA methylation 1-like [Cucurbita pepo subsp. pepo]|uniref:increased DNA methylation 1-like n=1 Tax=Cucurbita pepo subsp. pepo TaxID=3664 RepID=UPI000C9D5793|nr:increased DNA methylation 1-like [Cucurbita pepo subsp. pepo]